MKSARSTRPRILIVMRVILINAGKILLIKRSHKDSNNPLKWEIPGGKLDQGQDLETAAEREVIEEAGIYATPIKKFVFFEESLSNQNSRKYKGVPYIGFSSLYKSDSSRVRLSEEHEDFKWVSFEEALKMDITEFTRKSLLAWEEEILKAIQK